MTTKKYAVTGHFFLGTSRIEVSLPDVVIAPDGVTACWMVVAVAAFVSKYDGGISHELTARELPSSI